MKAGVAGTGEQEREGHVLKQKRQAASTHPSTLVPLTLCHPYTCHPGEETCLPCLRKQAGTADWAAKVAVTLSGFPTQLREKQSLPSAALSAPLYIKNCFVRRHGIKVADCSAVSGDVVLKLGQRGLPLWQDVGSWCPHLPGLLAVAPWLPLPSWL